MTNTTVTDEQTSQLLGSMSEEQLKKLRDSVSPSELKAEIEEIIRSMSPDMLKKVKSNEIEFKQKVAKSALTKIMIKKAKVALAATGVAGVAGAGVVAAGSASAAGASGSLIGSLTSEQKEIFAPFIERMDPSSFSSPEVTSGVDIDLGDIIDSVLDSVGNAITDVDWGELVSRVFRSLLGGG